MGDAFLIVAVLLIVFWIAAWLIAGARGGDVWRQIGRGGLSLDMEDRHFARPESAAEREADLRALLAARDERRAARLAHPGTGTDAPPARDIAVTPDADPGLVAELREAIVSRNERRLATGREPVDVEAEIARLLALRRRP